MNYVYSKKIFYFHLIKKIITNVVLFLILFGLYSCSFHKVSNDLTLKVTKVGTINSSSNFIFIYPNSINLSLKYKSILSKISEKLRYFNFYEVKDIKQAKYAFIVNLDNNTVCKEEFYSNSNSIDLNYDVLSKLVFTKEAFTRHNSFLLEVYLINSENNYTKVMEGYTKIYDNIIISKIYDKGYLGFVMCSIDALFDKSVDHNDSNYQEYYYKCY